jgi:hypothetical protein
MQQEFGICDSHDETSNTKTLEMPNFWLINNNYFGVGAAYVASLYH